MGILQLWHQHTANENVTLNLTLCGCGNKTGKKERKKENVTKKHISKVSNLILSS